MNSYLANGICYVAVLLAGSSLVGFTVFLISGPFQILDLGFETSGILAFDIGLSLLFFIQHSGMMRKTCQSKAEKLFLPEYYNAVYAIASGITLLLMLVLWQQSDVHIYSSNGPIRWGIRLLFFTVGIGFMWGAVALGEFDPFGVKNIKNYLHGKSARINPFIVKGPYRLVRHPLYSCSIAMIWLCPYMTLDRLMFNVMWTAWIVIGAILEERDLVDVFGEDYRTYQEKVPMLLPRIFLKK
jgi:protein-S-isoprenylcysteine O-methyltransferase Ste14